MIRRPGASIGRCPAAGRGHDGRRTRAARPRAGGARVPSRRAARRGARPRRSPRSGAESGRSRSDDARASASGRSRPGSPTSGRRPGWRRRRATPRPMPARRPSTATSRPSRFGIDAARLAGRRAVAGRSDEGLDLDEQRAAALHRRGDDAAGRGLVDARRGRPARGRRPRAARCRPSRRRRPRPSSRTGSWRPGRGAARRTARPRG